MNILLNQTLIVPRPVIFLSRQGLMDGRVASLAFGTKRKGSCFCPLTYVEMPLRQSAYRAAYRDILVVAVKCEREALEIHKSNATSEGAVVTHR